MREGGAGPEGRTNDKPSRNSVLVSRGGISPVGRQPKSVVWGKDRTFESVDKAVTFVMEELSALERSDASVVTPSRLIGIHDIERMYTARKASCGI